MATSFVDLGPSQERQPPSVAYPPGHTNYPPKSLKPNFEQQTEQVRAVGPNLPDLLQAASVERRAPAAAVQGRAPELAEPLWHARAIISSRAVEALEPGR